DKQDRDNKCTSYQVYHKACTRNG
ncbi:hypothetical protein CCACVL1_12337, partial [Corchorus capsularis]